MIDQVLDLGRRFYIKVNTLFDNNELKNRFNHFDI